jgi:hypothetical protein
MGLALLLLLASAPAAGRPQLVRAESVRGPAVLSPRRLFNTGLIEEEQGNLLKAVQFYMSARLSLRSSFADELYARGASYRLVRILAGYDDDAAAAAAVSISTHPDAQVPSDLAPLIRSLLRRIDDDEKDGDLETASGVIESLRFRDVSRQTVIELAVGDERRLVMADGSIGPFSAGDSVRVLARRDRSRALASWRLIAIGPAEADGWQLLAVANLRDGSEPVADQ